MELPGRSLLMGRSLLRSLADFVITKVFPTSKAHVLPRREDGSRALHLDQQTRKKPGKNGIESEVFGRRWARCREGVAVNTKVTLECRNRKRKRAPVRKHPLSTLQNARLSNGNRGSDRDSHSGCLSGTC